MSVNSVFNSGDGRSPDSSDQSTPGRSGSDQPEEPMSARTLSYRSRQ